MKDSNRRRPRGAGGVSSASVEIDGWKGKASGPRTGRSLRWTLAAILFFIALALSAFRFLGAESFHPVVLATWQHSTALHAVSAGEHSAPLTVPSVHLRSIIFPDHTLLFQTYPPQFTTPSSLLCHYSPTLRHPPLSVDYSPSLLLVRCPHPPIGLHVSLSPSLPPTPHRWDAIAYAALLDQMDNSTVVFVKGLNLRPDRLSQASRYACVFGWQFTQPKFLLPSPALTVAQEIVRCHTPLSVLRRANARRANALVSVMTSSRRGPMLPSIASPVPIDVPPPSHERPYRMCVCTMVRNQARFMKEWIMYHARVGVQRWFIYDNGSNDTLPEIIRHMDKDGFNVTRHPWPWIKTQEAGFAHCALTARQSCEWVGFIDVDEFLYLPTMTTLYDVLTNHSTNFPCIGELRTTCHSFGPSGKKEAPAEGVMAGYTCRMASPERHKSIVRPEALSPSLMNVVHHFHLRDRFQYVNMDRSVMVINHYKYQVWDVFKEKFYRRVATYVADWQDEENVGSKDRAPGLGTKAVEPPDWPSRFCEVHDSGLRNWVMAEFMDPATGSLPWSE